MRDSSKVDIVPGAPVAPAANHIVESPHLNIKGALFMSHAI